MLRALNVRNLQGRLLLTYLGLMLLGLGGLIAWTGQQLQRSTLEQAERDLALQAHIIAAALGEPLHDLDEGKRGAGSTLQGLVGSYARTSGSRITVVDTRLRVVASSDDQAAPGNPPSGPELLAARDGRQAWDVRSDSVGQQRLFVAAPVRQEGTDLVGFVQLSTPMAPIQAEIGRTWLSLLVAGGVVLLATAVVSLILARQVADPVENLTLVSERLAAGQLDRRVTPDGPEEVRRLGLAFNRMAERVEEMLASQRAFVAHAAHELRSPLTSLQLRLEMLRGPGQGDPELAGRYLGQMEQEVQGLRRLVDHLLALSSLDEGGQLPRASLDLAPLLYDLADEMGPLVQHAGLDLRVDVPPHLPELSASAEQLRIVVRNLLDNAVKYTPSGGSVTLSADADDGEVRVSVSDTGVGIPVEALPHVFERFYRVDRSRSRRQGGAGLGLALVRSIVEAHGGRVEVASQPGQGTTFTVHLPAAPGATAVVVPSAARGA